MFLNIILNYATTFIIYGAIVAASLGTAVRKISMCSCSLWLFSCLMKLVIQGGAEETDVFHIRITIIIGLGCLRIGC